MGAAVVAQPAAYGTGRLLVRLAAVPLTVVALAAMPGAWFLGLSDLSPVVPLVHLSYLILVIGLPGTICWRRLTGGTGWLAVDAVIGTTFGLGIECLIYPLGRWLDVPQLPLAMPVLAVLLAVLPSRRPTDARVPWWIFTGVAAALAVAALWFVRMGSKLLALEGPMALKPNSDAPFQLAMAAELKHHFPPQIPYVAGEPLNYHWMVYNHIASAHWITKVELEVLLARVVPLELIVLTVLGVAATAVVLSGRLVAAPIGALLTVGAGDLTLWPWAINNGLFTDSPLAWTEVMSPTQAIGSVLILPLIAVTALLFRGGRTRGQLAGCWTVAVLLIAVLSATKATALPVYAAGLAIAWLYLLVRYRRFDATALWLATVTVAFYGVNFVVVMDQEAHGMEFAPGLTYRAMLDRMLPDTISAGGPQLAILTAGMVLSWLLPAVGAVLVRRRAARSDIGDPMLPFLLGGLGGAVVAMSLLRHFTESQIFFIRSAFVLGILIPAWGLASLSRRHLAIAIPALVAGAVALVTGRTLIPDRPGECADAECVRMVLAAPAVLAIAGALVGVLLLGLLLHLARSLPRPVRRWLPGRAWTVLLVAAAIGMTVQPTYSDVLKDTPAPRFWFDSVPPGGIPAARYIRAYAGPDDVVATNIHCFLPARPPCNTASFWISAYAERRTLIQGWAYTAKANSGPNPLIDPFWDAERLRQNDVVFTEPNRENLDNLWQSYHVRWLLYDSRLGEPPPALLVLTAQHVELGKVHVYKLHPPGEGTPTQQLPR